MSIIIEEGKRYVRRDGEVTGPMELRVSLNFSGWPFVDPFTGARYTHEGMYWKDLVSALDLISEYLPDNEGE